MTISSISVKGVVLKGDLSTKLTTSSRVLDDMDNMRA